MKNLFFREKDIVLHKEFGIGTVLYSNFASICVDFEITRVTFHDGYGLGRKYHCQFCPPDSLVFLIRVERKNE